MRIEIILPELSVSAVATGLNPPGNVGLEKLIVGVSV